MIEIFSKPIPPILPKNRFHLPWKNLNQPMHATTHKKKYENIKKGNLIKICKNISQILFIGFLLGVSYSASIGGISCLVGSAPNIFMKGFADRSIKQEILLLYLSILFIATTKTVIFKLIFLIFSFLHFQWLY